MSVKAWHEGQERKFGTFVAGRVVALDAGPQASVKDTSAAMKMPGNNLEVLAFTFFLNTFHHSSLRHIIPSQGHLESGVI